ncbi:MAG: aminotransferase class I/II-fold pyridoxal phosphate-dependent enzyme, partial [Proteobacteria bacterium]|nr:aminotransferase class I/II-fold pyridoxal phosphate-dependent enzyme [Pseudomonadota bacterium]
MTAVKHWYQARPQSMHDAEGYRTPSFAELALYRSIAKYRDYQKVFGVKDPFFQIHETRSGAKAQIGEKSYINFASYDYLGLNQHPDVGVAAKAAIDQFGTSVSASRLVAGERPLHRDLEAALARFYETEDCIVYVSGHATNVSAISTIVGPKDAIFYDEYVHNSAFTGAKLSGAKMISFKHGDPEDLERKLAANRDQHSFALVLLEGLYSMDGDAPDLARFIDVKRRYGAWLMIDEAHGLGVLGATGRGVAEHFGIDPREVDIWMGTLSKTLSSCGGYVCGAKELIAVLKYQSPGFVYSVGMPAASTAAALKSLELLETLGAERVKRLQANGQFFLAECKAQGLDVGVCQGFAVVPVIVGDPVMAIRLTDRLFERGVNALPIIYPAVPLKSDRVRFFITSEHTEEQLRYAARV